MRFISAATIATLSLGLCGLLAMGCSSSGTDPDDNDAAAPLDGSSDAAIGDSKVPNDGSFIDVLRDTAPAPDSFDPDAACTGTFQNAEFRPANLLFVVDRTGSMKCNPDTPTETCKKKPEKADPTKPSKWEITETALIDAWVALKQSPAKLSIGLLLFNSDNYCAVPNDPNIPIQKLNDEQLDRLTDAIRGANPQGETPLIGATHVALRLFDQNESGGKVYEGDNFVVLLTDGTETCDANPANKALPIQWAKNMADNGWARTFVLGVPGSEDERSLLSSIAFAGNTARAPDCNHGSDNPSEGNCHMDMTESGMDLAKDLKANLEKIVAQAIKCEYDVPEKGADGRSVDKNMVNVRYTLNPGDEMTTMPPSAPESDCTDSSNNGWKYNDKQDKILLCAGACQMLRNAPYANVQIQLGCKTVPTVR